MKRLLFLIMILMTPFANAQVQNDADGNFDSTTYVETNGTTSSTSAVNSTNVNTNTNLNTNTSTSTSNNTNLNTNNNTSTSTSTNTNTNTNNNVLSGGTTNTNTNNNNNVNITESVAVYTNTNNNTNNTTSNNTNNNTNTNVNTSESTSVSTSSATTRNTNINNNVSRSTQSQDINQRIESPPPSAIAPSIGSSYSQDLCTTGVSGAVQTQIFGLSGGKSITDINCERIKLSKTLYDMGMRVAAVSLMCQDERVWTAMKMAGTPCPYNGLIGDEAGAAWEDNLIDVPGVRERDVEKGRVTESPNMPR